MTKETARRLVMSATWKLIDKYDCEHGGLAGLTAGQTRNYLDRRIAYVNEHIFEFIDKETAQTAV